MRPWRRCVIIMLKQKQLIKLNKNHGIMNDEWTMNDMKNFGIRGPERVVFIGGNAKMSEFQAAMGICNLRHIDEEIAGRRAAADRYREHLQGVEYVEFFRG